MTLALENFNRVAQDPKYRDKIPFYLANIYFGQKKYDRSIEEGEKLLSWYKGEQDTAPVRKIIGQSYFNLGRYDKALPYLEQSVSSPSASPTDLYQAGYAYYKNAITPAPKKCLKELHRDNRPYPREHTTYWATFTSNPGCKQEALGAFKTAGGMDHDKTVKHDAWYNYALLSYETGNPLRQRTVRTFRILAPISRKPFARIDIRIPSRLFYQLARIRGSHTHDRNARTRFPACRRSSAKSIVLPRRAETEFRRR